MAHEIESLFYVREIPWHGLGIKVEKAPRSSEALELAGLNWTVTQESIYTNEETLIEGYKANVRSSDKSVLGIVSNRYSIVQNNEAFEFADNLLGEGVRYETAGSLAGGKRVWLLARLPKTYIILGDKIESYLVFSNSHDGNGAVRVAITPIRVVCQNTLNLAMIEARRMWSTPHVGKMEAKLAEAKQTLLHAEHYMHGLNKEAGNLAAKTLSDKEVRLFIEGLIEMPEKATDIQSNNIYKLRNELACRYYEAPDLKGMPKSGWRMMSAVSDFTTHAEPLRKTANYRENLFARTIDGHALIDNAYKILRTA